MLFHNVPTAWSSEPAPRSAAPLPCMDRVLLSLTVSFAATAAAPVVLVPLSMRSVHTPACVPHSPSCGETSTQILCSKSAPWFVPSLSWQRIVFIEKKRQRKSEDRTSSASASDQAVIGIVTFVLAPAACGKHTKTPFSLKFCRVCPEPFLVN
jgi:hypothetical protein